MKMKIKGFSTLELMVCLTIVGILAAIAIPSFQSYRAKQRANQAKQHLADIYSAEQTFFLQFRDYGTCLIVMGVSQSPQTLYGYGFNATTRRGVASTNCTDDNNENYSYFLANDISLGAVANNRADLTTTAVSATTFTAGAVGRISTEAGTPLDIWTIDEKQNLNNTQKGF